MTVFPFLASVAILARRVPIEEDMTEEGTLIAPVGSCNHISISGTATSRSVRPANRSVFLHTSLDRHRWRVVSTTIRRGLAPPRFATLSNRLFSARSVDRFSNQSIIELMESKTKVDGLVKGLAPAISSSYMSSMKRPTFQTRSEFSLTCCASVTKCWFPSFLSSGR